MTQQIRGPSGPEPTEDSLTSLQKVMTKLESSSSCPSTRELEKHGTHCEDAFQKHQFTGILLQMKGSELYINPVTSAENMSMFLEFESLFFRMKTHVSSSLLLAPEILNTVENKP